jgi:hypothetical protein
MDIVDNTDFCRACRYTPGFEIESDGRQLICHQCHGTGRRTVRVKEMQTGLTMQGEKNVRDAERRYGDAAIGGAV